MTSCAKCGRELGEHDGKILMGTVYYRPPNPYLCLNCWNKWTNVHKIKDKDWITTFEAWIGYEWKGVERMAKEKVVFT